MFGLLLHPHSHPATYFAVRPLVVVVGWALTGRWRSLGSLASLKQLRKEHPYPPGSLLAEPLVSVLRGEPTENSTPSNSTNVIKTSKRLWTPEPSCLAGTHPWKHLAVLAAAQHGLVQGSPDAAEASGQGLGNLASVPRSSLVPSIPASQPALPLCLTLWAVALWEGHVSHFCRLLGWSVPDSIGMWSQQAAGTGLWAAWCNSRGRRTS